MVDDERRGGLADAAQVAVACQDLFPAAAEAGPQALAAVVVGLAQPAAIEFPRAAGAAQRELVLFEGGWHWESAVFSPAPARSGVGRAAKKRLKLAY